MTRLALAAALVVSGCTSVRLGPVATGAAPAAVSASDAADGLNRFPVRVGPRWGFIDSTGALAVAPAFDEAQAFSEGRAGVRLGARWGYARPDGSLAGGTDYDSVFPFRNGRGRVVVGAGREARVGFVNADGAAVVAPSLTEALDYGPGGRAPARAEVAQTPLGLGLLERVGLHGSGLTPWLVLDAAGAAVAEVPAATLLAFGDAGAGGALAPFRASGRLPGVSGAWGFVDAAGAVAVEPTFRNAAPFSEGLARVSDRTRFGFVDGTGAVVVPLRYEQASAFSEGLAAVREGGLWGFVRPDGTVAIAPQFARARDVSGGLAAVQVGSLWGYADTAGRVVVAPRFSQADPFRGALARVTENGSAAYVNRRGETVWRAAP